MLNTRMCASLPQYAHHNQVAVMYPVVCTGLYKHGNMYYSILSQHELRTGAIHDILHLLPCRLLGSEPKTRTLLISSKEKVGCALNCYLYNLLSWEIMLHVSLDVRQA